jgi:hypothetical protein
MDYGKTDHELQKEGARFYQAITKKLNGVPPANDEAIKVKQALKPELQDRLTRERLVVFESNYGWAYTVGYGRSGDVTMLTPNDLA